VSFPPQVINYGKAATHIADRLKVLAQLEVMILSQSLEIAEIVGNRLLQSPLIVPSEGVVAQIYI